MDDMESSSGYAFLVGSRIFSWVSKRQATIAQLIVEVEYVVVA